MNATSFVEVGSKLLADYIDAEIVDVLHDIGQGFDRDRLAMCMRDKDIAFHCLRSLMCGDEHSEAIARSRIRDILKGDGQI